MKQVKEVNIVKVFGEAREEKKDIVIIEYPFTIFLNDKEIITLLCSPSSLKYLAIGFLHSEGYIDEIDEIIDINIDEEKGLAYVNIKENKYFRDRLRGKRTITSGCGKGTSFYNVIDSFKSKKIQKPLIADIEKIKDLIRLFNKKSLLFLDTGGVHSCALAGPGGILIFEEDIGRHNALDKIFGRVLIDNINVEDKMILTSGRISSEILIKAGRRQVPIIVSRSAPTSLAIEMAKDLNICLIGFARGQKMNIYTNI